MTIDDIKRDGEAGTPSCKMVPCDCSESGCVHDKINGANARRIARVPKLEDLALAGAEIVRAIKSVQEAQRKGKIPEVFDAMQDFGDALATWEELTNE